MLLEQVIRVLAEADLTANMVVNAIRLLSLADGTGRLVIDREDIEELFSVESSGTVRKYLASLRRAGVLDYNLGQASVDIWFLPDRNAPQQARNVPGQARSADSTNAPYTNGESLPALIVARGAAPWD